MKFTLSLNKRLLLVFVSLISLIGCQKDDLMTSIKIIEGESTNISNQRNTVTNAYYDDNNNPQLTILGSQRQNPYEVDLLEHAYAQVYGNSVNLGPSHYYIRFETQTIDELMTLTDSDINLYDFPLDYEVIEMGDYYEDPNIGEDEIPYYYGVVKRLSDIPNDVTYTKLADINLNYNSNETLMRRAFELTGNDYDEYLGNDSSSGSYRTSGNNNSTNDRKIPTKSPQNGETGKFPDTGPEDDDDNGGYGGGANSFYTINDCGCQVYSNPRKPGGCVNVDDTQLGFQGVRQVKVILKDTWFTEDETWTDDDGCWKINKLYRKNAWMWVKFKNNKAKYRFARSGVKASWEWAFTVKDYVGRWKSDPYNNIEVNYGMWSTNGTQAHRYWSAATVNNALHEFHDNAQQDGIATPPNKLDVYLGRSGQGGFALMGNYIRGNILENPFPLASAIIDGWIDIDFLDDIAVLRFRRPINEILRAFPDVHIDTEFAASDRLKRLAYHEFAHASHFVNVGQGYWLDVVEAETETGGHGDQFSDDADLIAVVESWAEYIGMSYAHRRYLGNSAFRPSSWEERLDRTWNENPNHIPIGLHHDLVDDVEPLRSCDQDVITNCTNIIADNVTGFTNAQMFSVLDENTRTIDTYQQNLINNHLGNTPNNQNQVNALFNSY